MTALLRLVADPSRLRLIKLLGEGEFCVCELVHLLGLSQPAVSQHLAKLRAAGLVGERRAGQWVFYRLERPRLEELLRSLQTFLATPLAETPGLESLAERLGALDRVTACQAPDGRPPRPAGKNRAETEE